MNKWAAYNNELTIYEAYCLRMKYAPRWKKILMAITFVEWILA